MFKIELIGNVFKVSKDAFYLSSDGIKFENVKEIIRAHVNGILDKHKIKNERIYFRPTPHSKLNLIDFKPHCIDQIKANKEIINEIKDFDYMAQLVENSLVKLPIVKTYLPDDFKRKQSKISSFLKKYNLKENQDYIITTLSFGGTTKTYVAVKHLGSLTPLFILRF